LENYTERAVADYLALCVLQVPKFASDAIMDFFLDDFCKEGA